MPSVGRRAARRAIAVLVSRFPLVTETFILREMIEMERQGQPVRLVPLLREDPEVVHCEALPWVRRALYTPFLSARILAANLRALRRTSLRYLALLARLLAGTASSANLLIRTMALFPKSVYLAERLNQEGIRHVHAHFATHPALAALIISSLTDITFSFTVHAHDIFVRRALLWEKIQRARFVRAISRFNRDFLVGHYPDLTAEKIQVIHVGIDPEWYGSSSGASSSPDSSPATPAGKPGLGMGNPVRLLSVAALKPYKGLPVLIEACRRLKEDGVLFRCDLVGDGPLRPQIERLISKQRLQSFVSLLGWLPQNEVAALTARASVFVLPSVVAADGQMEGIPVSLMEAMASGRPVVASFLSGIPELVDDWSGILVEPGNASALALAIERLIGDPELARRMSEKGRDKVAREFRLQDCVATLLERIDLENEPPSKNLTELLARSGWPGLAGSSVGFRRMHERRDSSVAEILASDGKEARELVLKIQKTCPGESRPAPERARLEFEVLSFLNRSFSRCCGDGNGQRAEPTERFGVPKPIHLDERAGSILMESCRGRALDLLIRETRMSRDERQRASLSSAVRRSGRWLWLFQQSTCREGDTAPVLAALIAGANKDLECCLGRGLAPKLARKIEAKLEDLTERADRSARWVVGQQGDFWPGNIYVDESTVEVIDFEGFREGLPYEDAAYFLVQLELFYAYPFVRKQFFRLRSAFLEGYLPNGVLAPGAYQLCRMAKALQILARPAADSSRSSLRPWWRERCLRAILRGAISPSGGGRWPQRGQP